MADLFYIDKWSLDKKKESHSWNAETKHITQQMQYIKMHCTLILFVPERYATNNNITVTINKNCKVPTVVCV